MFSAGMNRQSRARTLPRELKCVRLCSFLGLSTRQSLEHDGGDVFVHKLHRAIAQRKVATTRMQTAEAHVVVLVAARRLGSFASIGGIKRISNVLTSVMKAV